MSAIDPKPTNPLDGLLGYRIRRVSGGLIAELARDLGALGLKPSEATVLVLIAANPGVTQSEVGRMLGIQRANMAPLTARLDQAGLVRRARVDGRSHGLATTDEGMALCRAARAAMDAHDARLLARLPPAAREGLDAAIAALTRDAPED